MKNALSRTISNCAHDVHSEQIAFQKLMSQSLQSLDLSAAALSNGVTLDIDGVKRSMPVTITAKFDFEIENGRDPFKDTVYKQMLKLNFGSHGCHRTFTILQESSGNEDEPQSFRFLHPEGESSDEFRLRHLDQAVCKLINSLVIDLLR